MLTADRVIDDGDRVVRQALPEAERVAVGPFVFLDHYRHRTLRGISGPFGMSTADELSEAKRGPTSQEDGPPGRRAVLNRG